MIIFNDNNLMIPWRFNITDINDLKMHKLLIQTAFSFYYKDLVKFAICYFWKNILHLLFSKYISKVYVIYTLNFVIVWSLNTYKIQVMFEKKQWIYRKKIMMCTNIFI